MVYDRHQTESKLIDAVGRLLLLKGFDSLGVNAVAREAGVDKVLIYRYFGGMPSLLRAYGERGDFWPSIEEVIGSDVEAFKSLPLGERLEEIVVGLFDALLVRPQAIIVLASEARERNTLTQVLEDVRECWSEQMIQLTFVGDEANDPDILGIMNLLIAGMIYLLIRSRHIAVYGSLELDTESGNERIRNSIRQTCQWLGAKQQQ